MLIGIVAGVVCYVRRRPEEPAAAGTTPSTSGACTASAASSGIILLGVFATTAVNTAGANGLLYGNPSFFLKQLVAVTFASVYAFVFSYVALAVINKVTPVRVGEADELLGLDASLHGEEAYVHD